MDIDMLFLANYSLLLLFSHLLLLLPLLKHKMMMTALGRGDDEEESSTICRHLRLSQSTVVSLCAIKSKINHRNSVLIITLIYHIYQLMTKLHGENKMALLFPPSPSSFSSCLNLLLPTTTTLLSINVCLCVEVINQNGLKHSFGRFSINACTFISKSSLSTHTREWAL
jgi:hypothetical protein